MIRVDGVNLLIKILFFSLQLYDQPPTTPRKSLLPKSPQSPSSHTNDTQMVETSLFDIYLCDNCDAELYSLDAYKEHEKTCVVSDGNDDDDDDDDVILVDENELNGTEPMSTEQHEFLSNFSLFKNSNNNTDTGSSNTAAVGRRKTGSQQFGHPFSPDKQIRRMPTRTRAVLALSKCHSIPISSPCGQLLLKQSKTQQTEEYQQERIDRVERFCAAPPVNDEHAYNRYMTALSRMRGMNSNNITFRKLTEPQDDCHYHVYKWPRRQLSTKLRRAHFMFLNSLLLKACRPLSVKVKRLSDTDIEIQKAKLRLAAQKVSFAVPKVNPKVVEFIDLCSSDEEPDAPGDDMENNNYPTATATTDMTKIGDENRRLDGSVEMVPVNTPSFPVNQNVGIQPLRPSVFLFSNYQNGATATNNTASFFQNSHQDTIAKNNSIKHWLESQSSSPLQRKIPRLINIQQYATTTIRTTITASDFAT